MSFDPCLRVLALPIQDDKSHREMSCEKRWLDHHLCWKDLQTQLDVGRARARTLSTDAQFQVALKTKAAWPCSWCSWALRGGDLGCPLPQGNEMHAKPYLKTLTSLWRWSIWRGELRANHRTSQRTLLTALWTQTPTTLKDLRGSKVTNSFPSHFLSKIIFEHS